MASRKAAILRLIRVIEGGVDVAAEVGRHLRAGLADSSRTSARGRSATARQRCLVSLDVPSLPSENAMAVEDGWGSPVTQTSATAGIGR
jgi:hypothetical protein